MRIRYRYARSLLVGFLAVVLLFSLVPAASAAQQNSYHDPAENWKEALDRTNELDANAVVTHETFDCAYCIRREILSSIVLQSIPVQGKRR